jgi:hypothetical protein
MLNGSGYPGLQKTIGWVELDGSVVLGRLAG